MHIHTFLMYFMWSCGSAFVFLLDVTTGILSTKNRALFILCLQKENIKKKSNVFVMLSSCAYRSVDGRTLYRNIMFRDKNNEFLVYLFLLKYPKMCQQHTTHTWQKN